MSLHSVVRRSNARLPAVMASGTLTAARPAAAGYESTAPAASLAHLVELLCSVDQRQVSSFLCRQIVLLVFTVRVRERCYARPKADAARRRVQEFLPRNLLLTRSAAVYRD